MSSLWFEGEIPDAVTKAKSLNAIFIVLIEGADDLSKQYGEFFKDEGILKLLSPNQFVGVRVEGNSTLHQQFGAIYPQTSVPSIFFIGKNGAPLEVVKENLTKNEFITKVQLALLKFGFSQGAVVEGAQANVPPEASAPSTSQGNADFEVSSDSSTVSDIPPSFTVSDLSISSSDTTQSDRSIEERAQALQELIKKRREEKEKEEAEKEKMREMERRKAGQSLQEFKKRQEDEELKQLKEERAKEKRENQEARERILAQIAQDKKERALKFSNATPNAAPTPSAVPERQPASSSNTARLQFRLPDGGSDTHIFEATDTLRSVHDYIHNNIQINFQNYYLATTFPRREFTAEDVSSTLRELNLTPSAVILILPIAQGTVSANVAGNTLNGYIWWLVSPLISIYYSIVRFVSSSFQTPPPPSSPPPPADAQSGKRSSDNEYRRNTNKKHAGETIITKRGNVHRLQDNRDSDDENNTWNGNSTQQM